MSKRFVCFPVEVTKVDKDGIHIKSYVVTNDEYENCGGNIP